MSDLKSVIGGIQVPSATPADYVVLAPQTVGVLFSDGFESGDLSHVDSTSGAYWGGGSNSVVSTDNPKNGTYSLKVTYVGTTNPQNPGLAEQRFHLGGAYRDIWIKYDVFVPINHYHRVAIDNISNGKLIAIWGGNYNPPGADGPKLLLETGPGGDGGARTNAWAKAYVNDSITAIRGFKAPGEGDDLFRPSDNGTWVSLIANFSYDTTSTNQSGRIDLWKKASGANVYSKTISIGPETSTKISDIDLWWSTKPDSTVQIGSGFDVGYFFGASNGGYDETTIFYIDNVIISTESLL